MCLRSLHVLINEPFKWFFIQIFYTIDYSYSSAKIDQKFVHL